MNIQTMVHPVYVVTFAQLIVLVVCVATIIQHLLSFEH